ncbi:MAG: TonB-dependent siderophore receptor [Phormidesmis sp.]
MRFLWKQWPMLVAFAFAFVGVPIGPTTAALAQTVDGSMGRSAIALTPRLPNRLPEKSADKLPNKLPNKSLETSLAQATPIAITGIQVEETSAGLSLRLATTGELTVTETSITGNAATATLANAALTLPDASDFQQFEPAAGIALVSVTSLPNDQVQIAVTGQDAPPTVDISTGTAELTLSATLGDPAVQTTDEAIRLLVTGEEGEEDSYVVPNATTATRTETPLRDVPQSVQVIPQAVIEDQEVLRLGDALRNVSGVVSNSNDPRGERFIIRGFSDSSILRDGFRQTDSADGNAGFQELATVEQVEVLKGPAAILAGALEPGGAINLITERPLAEPFYEVGLTVGSRSILEPSVDVSGPLSSDGRVLYRLNMLLRQQDAHTDFTTPIDRNFIAPVVSWAINERTDLLFDVEYSNQTRPAEFAGLPALGERVADVPRDRITGEPEDDARNESLRAGYELEHRFSDNWTIRNRFQYVDFDSELIANIVGQVVNEETGDLFRIWLQNEQDSESYELQTNVVGKFNTGSIEHTLLAGVDWYHRDARTLRRFDFTPQPLFNIFNPVYGVPRPASFATAPPLTFESRTESLGVYVQDQVELFDGLFLLAGLRYDTVTQEAENLETNVDTSQSEDAFTPRFGVVYQPSEQIALYGSYSTSFRPNSGTTRDDNFLDPESGEQFEVGIRGDFLSDRLSANLAWFNITKQNVATADPNSLPGQNFVVATGEQRSQGVELDVIGEILPGWNIVANYAYTDTDITQDNTGLQGNDLFGVPEHNANLWTTYEIQDGDLAGLGFSIGLNYVGERFGDNANSYVLEDYFLTNAALSYERDNWRAALNVRNLFDVNYIESSEGFRFIENRTGEGITIIGSVSVEF